MYGLIVSFVFVDSLVCGLMYFYGSPKNESKL